MPTASAPPRSAYASLGREVEHALRQQHLALWYPRTLDPLGGFHQDFSRSWKRTDGLPKTIVYQARLTWLASQVALSRPDLRKQYLPYAIHGADFLINRMWDKKLGGFWWQLDPGNKQPTSPLHEKHVYGNSFAIYALAAAYRATKRAPYKQLAMRTFDWLEEHALDRVNGGYIDSLYADGRPMLKAPVGLSPRPRMTRIVSRWGTKSMNSHIHMLEACTELYHATGKASAARRLNDLLDIILQRIISPRNTQYQFLSLDWRPAKTDAISFGHDVETVYLLIEAAEAVGRHHEASLLRKCHDMFDTSIRFGWDGRYGGLCAEGHFGHTPTSLKKVWWMQVENLNAALLMHDLFGRRDGAYWKVVEDQWGFIRDRMIDPKYGGLFNEVSPDGSKVLKSDKASKWKCPYHDGRSFLRTADRLNSLAAR